MGEYLASVSRTLVSQFKDARQELSLRHDVPVGDSGSTAA